MPETAPQHVQWVTTVAGRVPVVDATVVLKNEIGLYEGYFALDVRGVGIVTALDQAYYTDEVFLQPGDGIQCVLQHHGGFTGRKVTGADRVRTLTPGASVDHPWRSVRLVGEITGDSYFGSVIDCGAGVACFFALTENEALLQQRRTAGGSMTEEEIIRPATGDWISATGDLSTHLLKQLELRCTGCSEATAHLTTSFPSNDEAEFVAQCVCGAEVICLDHPEQCPRCRRKMWTWAGKEFTFPLPCARCGAARFDFRYEHQPRLHTRQGVPVPPPPVPPPMDEDLVKLRDTGGPSAKEK